jgi:polysaccharide pyruvyl transferase WcaK-like protein/2-polyprenyl-3-methyl-5-hydroxy-6-metoxy-1,4-benzoquinol methylase
MPVIPYGDDLIEFKMVPFPLQIETHQMFNGLGAGNIGDELMMLGFLNLIHPKDGSTIEIWDENSSVINWFPKRYRYIPWRDDRMCEQHIMSSHAVLLVGDTPVTELVGLDWPLKALREKLLFCHKSGIPVYAVGVGVDQLKDPEALQIFYDAFLPISSWTVRSASCRHALTALGVPDDRIIVASDLAWLYEPVADVTSWALSQWELLGIDVNRPLVGVNVVCEVWGSNVALYRNLAIALDRIAEDHDAQIAFMCNEVREGAYFDRAAAEVVMGMMKTSPVFLPNHYYHPDEMIGLLSQVDVSLSQRYHFTIESVMAGTVPVSFARGQKLSGLIEEIGMNPVGNMDMADPDDIYFSVTDALDRGAYWRNHLLKIRKQMRLRAMNNKYFVQQLSAENVGYQPGFAVADGADIASSVRLASVSELESTGFRAFMAMVNGLAVQWGLRVFTNWSKIWEYPWLWFNILYKIKWQGKHLVDMGSEISPMPWLMALLGARVTLIETDAQWVPVWEKLRDRFQLDVQWHIVSNEILPIPDASVDILTSFSVIEHQPDKIKVIDEINRVLKPGAFLAISFDICEPEMGMSFPEWNGAALTMHEFETTVWMYPAFGNQSGPEWNLDDIPAFLSWHKTSAPHHGYVVGAAVLQKEFREPPCIARFLSGWFDEESDASGYWRWSDHQGFIELHCNKDHTTHIQFEIASAPLDNKVHMLLDDREVMVVDINWSGFKSPSPVAVDIRKGIHTLTFYSHKTSVTVPLDSRLLAFSIKNFTLSSCFSNH